MPDVLVSALISVLTRKATDQVFQQFGVMWGISEKLEELERKLSAIKSIIGNAEERQAEDHVKRWLEGLKERAYQADDILDEFNVEVMRRKAANDMTKKVRSFFSFHNPVLFRFHMGRKLNDINEKINGIITEGHQFHFTPTTQPQNRDRPNPPSYPDESTVIGRGEDKEKIVKLLLDHDNNNQKVAVLPIVGMGGLGKTTLAQLIYKDDRVVKHFQPLIWVCMSDEFEVLKLTKAIITLATNQNCVESTMELLQQRLREVLSGKRYFLVLDDVWNHDWQKWNGLKFLLETGKGGSKIIVTTRSEQVASIMGTLTPHYLQHLNEDDSWTLFKKRAFKDGAEEPQNLVSIGKDIVKKCDGLPLALKVLGALMYSMSQEAEWLSVKNSEIWNLPDVDKILSILGLSYRDLPSHLKQCFAFCAIFPKGHVMEKNNLIGLWMANEFIPSDEGKELQDKGNEIFNELAWRSFFQDIKEYDGYIRRDEVYCKTTCKMHNLMHDLAQSNMGNECLSSLEQISKKTRHLYIPRNFQFDIQRTLNTSPNIRTLLVLNWSSRIVVTGDSLKSVSLKALKLSDTNITQLLNAIGFLKHLRYLDLSDTGIKALPEATCTLLNLQTLKLSYCWQLCKLPDGMKIMSNLRHLYLDGCTSLKCLPTSMGQLKSLRILTKYIVGNEKGRGIDELNGLNLGGRLELYNLKNVRDATDAKKADLSCKRNLCSLLLCWNTVGWNEYNCPQKDVVPVENAEEVLEGLRPHDGLKLLTILCYGGSSFPMWMKDPQLLQNLVEIHLEVCMGCEHLPPLWQSRSLKFLCLKDMDKVKHICSGNEINGTVEPFPSLKRLVLNGMQSLKTWLQDEETSKITLVFPLLAELKIIDCPNLMTMPGLPSLERLEMEGSFMQLGLASNLTPPSSLRIGIHLRSSEIKSPPLPQKKIVFSCFKTLERFDIMALEDLVLLLEEEEEEMKGLSTSLQYLMITGCNRLFSSPQQSSSPLRFWMNLTSLLYLDIYDCDDLVNWPEEEFRGLISLKKLHICRCDRLIGLSPSPSSSSSSSGDEELLPNLEELHIAYCDGLINLPKLPTSLRSLKVASCPKLQSLTEGLRYATALDKVDISCCESLTSSAVDLGHLTALTSMRINELPGLESLPQGLGQLVALQSLEIINCSKFSYLPEGMRGLTALQRLHIQHCPRLSSLPDGLQQRFPSLQALIIEGCPNLERECRRGGLYWLSQITN